MLTAMSLLQPNFSCRFLDNRNIPALGRIGDPDDIIASVRVEDGEVRTERETLDVSIVWLLIARARFWLTHINQCPHTDSVRRTGSYSSQLL